MCSCLFRFKCAFTAIALSLMFTGSISFATEKSETKLLPRRSFLVADSSKQLIAIIDEQGEQKWSYRIGPLHDQHRLANGNILFQTSWTKLIEIDPKTGNTVWEYDSGVNNGNRGKRIEVHAFQRLENGLTMIAESGVGRIIEVNSKGELVHEMALQIKNPSPHQDTRLVRVIANGNYLVCHENKGAVYEYTRDGKVVWSYEIPLFDKKRKGGHGIEAHGNQCYAALRLKNGNTLISTGNGHQVIEVTSDKKVVWSLGQNELPGIQLAWVTSLQVLPSGNIVIGNCHAGPKNPQVIEINRNKEVVWKFHDFKNFGNSLTNSQILSVDGDAVTDSLR